MSRRISILIIEQIKELKAQGKPIRKIAAVLGISRNTVRRYLREEESSQAYSSSNFQNFFNKEDWRATIPWDEVIKKRQCGYQINRLHQEYGSESVSYWAFNRALSKVLATSTQQIVIPQQHKPGEKVQVDYTEGLKIKNPKTGKLLRTHLFCGVLAHSGYTFAEFTLNQKLTSFIGSHENMWHYFGGVAKYVVPDNLKAGVKKAHRYDPVINPTFCDFANHCGFAVLPTRPYRPRDKGIVEATIGAIQRSFYQTHKDTIFYSLNELNQCFKEFLKMFNNRIMKDYGVSRLERFQSEKDLLEPIPRYPYQVCEWKEAKVHPDCHIQVQHAYYSVPFRYVGQNVRVKKTARAIEIFSQDLESIAFHRLLTRKGSRSTLEGHLPEERLQASRFEIKQAIEKARAIGPNMLELMEQIFSSPRPLVGLRKSQGILRTLGKDGIGKEAMEYAAGQCLSFHKSRSDYFRQCAHSFQKISPKGIHIAPNRNLESVCLRGGDN